jgi:hypothetical protein
MHAFLLLIGSIVVAAAVATSAIALWSLLPRPKRFRRKA